MLRYASKIIGLTAVLAVMVSPVSKAIDSEAYDTEYFDRVKIDRYLDVEVWTNHSDNEFYAGDNIVVSFRANRDAFMAIYTIDSRGHVNLLFPSSPDQDNYVQGGVTYTIPDGADDFDLVVTGPEGVENIQAIASRERFPIPDWFPTSGLVCDWDDRFEYMDYVNGEFFVRYSGQRFAFDRTAMYINEWEPDYYRPIYYPHYPGWTVCGNAYIDYPWGATVYINGVYWGVTPLYIPRIYVGWHTFTIYDYYGSCWEYPVHVTRYNTVILDRAIVVPSTTVVSKYKEVREIGYRNPVKHGYPNYKTKEVITTAKTGGGVVVKDKTVDMTLPKKYTKGSAKVIKTDRGYETVATGLKTSKGKSADKVGSAGVNPDKGSSSTRYKRSDRNSSGSKSSPGSSVSKPGSSGKSSDYYQKKSGTTSDKKSSTKSSKPAQPSGKGATVKKSNTGSKNTTTKSPGTVKSSTKSDPNKGGSSGKSSGTVKSSTKSDPNKGGSQGSSKSDKPASKQSSKETKVQPKSKSTGGKSKQ